MTTLKVSNLKKHFGGVKALDGVSFEVKTGECVAPIGPNGAGKSTCFATLAGQHRPDAGTVEWGDEPALQDITGRSAATLSQLGIGRTFQVAQVFEALTVLQNLQLAEQQILGPSRVWGALLPLKRLPTTNQQILLDQLGLGQVAHTQALLLPYGLKKRLELGIALTPRPQLLLLDEPAAGLAQAERHELMALIKSLTDSSTYASSQPSLPPNGLARVGHQPIAVLYTEHNMDAVFGVADRVLVLIDGQLAAQGTAAEVKANPLVRQRYLGGDSSLNAPSVKSLQPTKAEVTHG
jgi:branched-chain amino acid transport system ATP-binding protein